MDPNRPSGVAYARAPGKLDIIPFGSSLLLKLLSYGTAV